MSSGASDMSRKPFQPLILTPNGVSRSASPCVSFIGARDDNCMARAHSRPSSVVRCCNLHLQRFSFVLLDLQGNSYSCFVFNLKQVQNLDYMLQKLKGMGRSEAHHEWHMVVDTTCLMDPDSFKSLKLLEGIKEVRLIIPQIGKLFKWGFTCLKKKFEHPQE